MKLSELRKLTQSLPAGADRQDQAWRNEFLRSQGLDPGNLYQELEMDSRFVNTHRDVSLVNSQVNLHSHSFYELLLCRGCQGVEYLIGAERYRLQKGDVVIVPPGISHRPLLPEQMEVPYERYVLWLSGEFMGQYANLLPYPFTEKQAQASLLRTRGTAWEHLGDLFLAGVQETEQQLDGWEAAVIGNTIQLLTQIKRATDLRHAHALKAEKPELLDRITAYIEKNYARSMTIDQLSREFFISSSTVSHLFQQKLGVSFYRYVTQRRLIAAKTLIERGALLEDVAVQVGFSDYSGFYRAFKKEFGISPRQYRALQQTPVRKAAAR